ncbi:Cyclic pyranopterin monophosphate synthase [Rubripirellula obstinata]|uniref:Cyclic pyranopterin monophosphate synthase n=1 Tax=Rubripirellula obstinata TaxID=406547 RepID=A0A5B1CC90_9BACT|nr:radical SAM protein [Rubripirellula obstinata]KAA1258176.1 Cyclic pyranopterin monophosphate synthase [Rubripirellula obstinata]
MDRRLPLPALEYHVAHGCNLSCQQCSHYSNFHVAGSLPTVDEADADYSKWSHRLRPKRFALLGGEPLLNPQLIEHIQLARKHWSDSNLMLVTNGFFLHRFPELPKVLVDTNCRLEVSQHGTHDDYVKRFREVKRLVWRWREEHPGIQIKIRQSHRGWMRQYNVENGKPMPFDSKPDAAFKVCMQKTCTQLYRGMLWKCPALAYFAQLEAKLNLRDLPQWQLFRDYKAITPDATDDELRKFIETKAIPQCGLCPSNRTKFTHPNPLQRSVLP